MKRPSKCKEPIVGLRADLVTETMVARRNDILQTMIADGKKKKNNNKSYLVEKCLENEGEVKMFSVKQNKAGVSSPADPQ